MQTRLVQPDWHPLAGRLCSQAGGTLLLTAMLQGSYNARKQAAGYAAQPQSAEAIVSGSANIRCIQCGQLRAWAQVTGAVCWHAICRTASQTWFATPMSSCVKQVV